MAYQSSHQRPISPYARAFHDRQAATAKADGPAPPTTATGRISQILTGRGYGFIKRDGLAEDAFFHEGQLIGLEFSAKLVGQRVQFELVTDEETGKPRARNVRAVE